MKDEVNKYPKIIIPLVNSTFDKYPKNMLMHNI